MKVCNITQATC